VNNIYINLFIFICTKQFHKKLIDQKSTVFISALFRGQASRPYNDTGIHLLQISCNVTFSEAKCPILSVTITSSTSRLNSRHTDNIVDIGSASPVAYPVQAEHYEHAWTLQRGASDQPNERSTSLDIHGTVPSAHHRALLLSNLLNTVSE